MRSFTKGFLVLFFFFSIINLLIQKTYLIEYAVKPLLKKQTVEYLVSIPRWYTCQFANEKVKEMDEVDQNIHLEEVANLNDDDFEKKKEKDFHVPGWLPFTDYLLPSYLIMNEGDVPVPPVVLYKSCIKDFASYIHPEEPATRTKVIQEPQVKTVSQIGQADATAVKKMAESGFDAKAVYASFLETSDETFKVARSGEDVVTHKLMNQLGTVLMSLPVLDQPALEFLHSPKMTDVKKNFIKDGLWVWQGSALIKNQIMVELGDVGKFENLEDSVQKHAVAESKQSSNQSDNLKIEEEKREEKRDPPEKLLFVDRHDVDRLENGKWYATAVELYRPMDGDPILTNISRSLIGGEKALFFISGSQGELTHYQFYILDEKMRNTGKIVLYKQLPKSFEKEVPQYFAQFDVPNVPFYIQLYGKKKNGSVLNVFVTDRIVPLTNVKSILFRKKMASKCPVYFSDALKEAGATLASDVLSLYDGRTTSCLLHVQVPAEMSADKTQAIEFKSAKTAEECRSADSLDEIFETLTTGPGGRNYSMKSTCAIKDDGFDARLEISVQ